MIKRGLFVRIGVLAMLLLVGGLTAAKAQSTESHRIVVRHPSIAKNQPKPYALSQTLDQHGHPSGYSMVVDSVICLDEHCKVVKVTMTWDAMGAYQSYALADGTILEKARIDHTDPPQDNSPWTSLAAQITNGDAVSEDQAWAPFTRADHEKLDQILGDSSSILRTETLSNLTSYRDKSKVDGVSGATPLAVKEGVVEGAALSSYHLWHWANGGVVAAARELTHLHCDEALLKRLLDHDEPHYVLFALEHLRRHKLVTPSLVSAVIDRMSGGDQDRIDLGVAYLRAVMPDQDAFYDKLATLFLDSTPRGRTYLLGLLSSEQEIPGAHLDTMSLGLEDTQTYYELHRFLALMEKHKHASRQVLTQASRFLDSENFFIARRAFQYLNQQPLDEEMTHRIKAFRDQSEKEGRILH